MKKVEKKEVEMCFREIKPSGTSFSNARSKDLDQSFIRKKNKTGFDRYYHRIIQLPTINSTKSIVQEIEGIRETYGHQFEDSEAACRIVIDKFVTYHSLNSSDLKVFVKKDFKLPKYLPPKIFSGQVGYVFSKELEDSPRPLVIEVKSNKALLDKNSEYQILAEMLAAIDWNRRWNIELPVYGILASADYFRFLELYPKYLKGASNDVRNGLSISENLNWFNNFHTIELFFKFWFNKAKSFRTIDSNSYYIGWNRQESIGPTAVFHKGTKEMVGRSRNSSSLWFDISHMFFIEGSTFSKELYEKRNQSEIFL